MWLLCHLLLFKWCNSFAAYSHSTMWLICHLLSFQQHDLFAAYCPSRKSLICCFLLFDDVTCLLLTLLQQCYSFATSSCFTMWLICFLLSFDNVTHLPIQLICHFILLCVCNFVFICNAFDALSSYATLLSLCLSIKIYDWLCYNVNCCPLSLFQLQVLVFEWPFLCSGNSSVTNTFGYYQPKSTCYVAPM